MAGITDMAAPFNGINDSGLIQEAPGASSCIMQVRAELIT